MQEFRRSARYVSGLPFGLHAGEETEPQEQKPSTKGPRTNNLDNLSALRKERVVPVWMESSGLKIQFFHL